MHKIIIALAVYGAITATLASDSVAKTHRHHEHDKRAVWTVYDRMPDEWQAALIAEVADFNANMPKHGPRLRYVKLTPQICDEARNERIDACGGDGINHAGDPYWGWATWGRGGMHVLGNVTSDGPVTAADRRAVICHELMHVVARVVDHYNTYPDTSCVWGSLDHLGPTDIAQLREQW